MTILGIWYILSGFRHLSGTYRHFPHAEGLSKPGILRIEPGCGWHLTVSLPSDTCFASATSSKSVRRCSMWLWQKLWSLWIPPGFQHFCDTCSYIFQICRWNNPNLRLQGSGTRSSSRSSILNYLSSSSEWLEHDKHTHAHTCHKYLITW